MSPRYAVFGHPIGHSRSPAIHQAFARQTGQELSYEAIDPGETGFAAAVAEFRAARGAGANVTVPFKVEAVGLATEISERARLAGAANFLKLEPTRVIADNVDGVGLVRDVQLNMGYAIQGKRVLMLGAGGAARGCTLPILAEKPACLVLVNRTVSKAIELGQRFAGQGPLTVGGYPDLGKETFDLVINATSASLRGELPAVPGAVFHARTLAYDLVYGKGLLPFLRLARDSGAARLADGGGMLAEQAAESFFLWRGARPDTRTLIAELATPLV